MADPADLKPLTSIRGFAALWVYLYHRSNMLTGSDFFREFMRSGYFGLDIFFILSGFIISHVHQDDFRDTGDVKRNAWPFLWLRLFRIYPLYLCTLMPFVYLQEIGAGFQELMQHLLMIQSWGGSANAIWNVPAWSISVEWLIYLLFPLLALALTSRASSPRANMAALAAALALWVFYLRYTDRPVIEMVEPLTCLPRGFLDFMIGAFLQNLFRQKVLEKLPWDYIAAGMFAGLLGVIFARSQGIAVHDVAVIAVEAALVFSLANIRGWAHYIFSNRGAVYLGAISYSLYMWQWLYLLLVAKYRDISFAGLPFFDWHVFAETLGLIALAAASYHLIENPARKFGRRLLEEERAAA